MRTFNSLMCQRIVIFINRMIPITIQVKPGAFKDKIMLDEEGKFIIKIKEKPIDRAANVSLAQ